MTDRVLINYKHISRATIDSIVEKLLSMDSTELEVVPIANFNCNIDFNLLNMFSENLILQSQDRADRALTDNKEYAYALPKVLIRDCKKSVTLFQKKLIRVICLGLGYGDNLLEYTKGKITSVTYEEVMRYKREGRELRFRDIAREQLGSQYFSAQELMYVVKNNKNPEGYFSKFKSECSAFQFPINEVGIKQSGILAYSILHGNLPFIEYLVKNDIDGDASDITKLVVNYFENLNCIDIFRRKPYIEYFLSDAFYTKYEIALVPSLPLLFLRAASFQVSPLDLNVQVVMRSNARVGIFKLLMNCFSRDLAKTSLKNYHPAVLVSNLYAKAIFRSLPSASKEALNKYYATIGSLTLGYKVLTIKQVVYSYTMFKKLSPNVSRKANNNAVDISYKTSILGDGCHGEACRELLSFHGITNKCANIVKNNELINKLMLLRRIFDTFFVRLPYIENMIIANYFYNEGVFSHEYVGKVYAEYSRHCATSANPEGSASGVDLGLR